MRMHFTTLIATISLAGCNGVQKDGENSASVTTDAARSDWAPTASGKDALGIATADLPDFVGLPKGARMTTNMRMNDGDKVGGTLTLETFRIGRSLQLAR